MKSVNYLFDVHSLFSSSFGGIFVALATVSRYEISPQNDFSKWTIRNEQESIWHFQPTNRTFKRLFGLEFPLWLTNSCNVVKTPWNHRKITGNRLKTYSQHSSFGLDKFTIYVGNECVMVCKQASKLVNDVASIFPEYGSFYREREIDTHKWTHYCQT